MALLYLAGSSRCHWSLEPSDVFGFGRVNRRRSLKLWYRRCGWWHGSGEFVIWIESERAFVLFPLGGHFQNVDLLAWQEGAECCDELLAIKVLDYIVKTIL